MALLLLLWSQHQQLQKDATRGDDAAAPTIMTTTTTASTAAAAAAGGGGAESSGTSTRFAARGGGRRRRMPMMAAATVRTRTRRQQEERRRQQRRRRRPPSSSTTPKKHNQHVSMLLLLAVVVALHAKLSSTSILSSVIGPPTAAAAWAFVGVRQQHHHQQQRQQQLVHHHHRGGARPTAAAADFSSPFRSSSTHRRPRSAGRSGASVVGLQQHQQQQQQPPPRRSSSSSSSSSSTSSSSLRMLLSSSTYPADENNNNDDDDGDDDDNADDTTTTKKKNSSSSTPPPPPAAAADAADAAATVTTDAAAITRLQQEAARMRLEAERMDWELTNQKLQALQEKTDRLLRRLLQRNTRTAADGDAARITTEEALLLDLERQIDQLGQKLENDDDDDDNSSGSSGNGSSRTVKTSRSSSTRATTTGASPFSKGSEINKSVQQESSSRSRSRNVVSSSESPVASSSSAAAVAEPEAAAATKTATMVLEEEKENLPETDDDWVVFDDHDLELYLPVAREIEARLAPRNATADEKLQAFRTAPALQAHFQKKIAQLIVEPMQDVQRLEELQSQYLRSTSVREKDHLKRQIDKLSQTLEDEYGRFQYSDSVYRPVPPLSEARLRERLATLNELPPVLQTLYLKRYQLPGSNSTTLAADMSSNDADTAQFRLALLLDHYEQQMQLLDQVQLLGPAANNVKQRGEVEEAVASLPPEVRRHLAEKLRVPPAQRDDAEALVRALLTRSEQEQEGGKMVFSNLSPLSKVVMEAMDTTTTPSADDPSYSDIAFVDRSRYLEEFYPCIARMESQHPSPEAAETFAQSYIDRRSFMVTSKPERVIGGWYIRGRNLLASNSGNGDNDGGAEMMEQLRQRVNDTSLQFFYIPDPSPLSDEEVELEYRNDPVIVLTANDPRKFYNYADPWVKAGVSAVGVASIVLFALGVCALEPALQDRLNAQIDRANAGEIADLSWLTSIASDVVLALGSIQLAHELGHRWIAWRDRFDVGLPTPVPSVQLGCLGTITPLKSPPPNLKSLFDFGVSGPLFGTVASIAFLVQGLTITANLDLNQVSTLPVLPSELVSTSALGGGLIETFLGRGALIQGASQGFLPLHPFAIAGFLGILTNALALLPLGNTDGGRIALAMFGRRGAYIVKTFTTAMLCLAGVVGFDKAGVLLTYVLFVVIWQRELEAPARNEVEELDFVRGASGIVMAIFVALALLPIQ